MIRTETKRNKTDTQKVEYDAPDEPLAAGGLFSPRFLTKSGELR